MKNENNNLPNPIEPGRPARSRFNFSNSRFQPAVPPATTQRNTDREERRKIRKQNRSGKPKVQDKNGALVFNVAQLMRSPEGETRKYDVEADELEIENEQKATNIKGHARFTRVRHELLVQGDFEADTVLECVRCLNNFDYHLTFQLEDIYRPSIDVVTGLPVPPEEGEDDESLMIDENHLINLGEALRQQILVSQPMFPHCGDNCPGLYQYLEKANEDVPVAVEEAPGEEEIDKRWQALKKLHLDE